MTRRNNDGSTDVYVTDLCNNYIEGRPVLTYEEACDIAGRELDPLDEYYGIPNMGGTCELKDGSYKLSDWRITISDCGVFDEYGESIYTKESVKKAIDKLQMLYENYDSYYDTYVKEYREKVISFAENMFRNGK